MPVVVAPGTEAVIEGYPRSGNTFAVAAFRLAQHRPVQLAHHVHAPAQVLEGLRLRLPVMVLIRRPDDAVLSTVIRARVGIEAALRMYIRFYERILPRRDEVVVAPFTTVIQDFGSLIVEMNARYGTAFEVFNHDAENEQHVFRSIEARGRRDASLQHRDHEEGVARPSAAREARKRELRERYATEAPPRLRATAQRLYLAFVGDDG